MPKITAIIHARNDEARIARALDSLRPCDDLLVIDHSSSDDTVKLARSHGARIKAAIPGVEAGTYVIDARHLWVLCLLPTESVGEALEASLLEFKDKEFPQETRGFRIAVREETETGWESRAPEMRLVNRACINWTTELPPNDTTVDLLEGELLRFRQP